MNYVAMAAASSMGQYRSFASGAMGRYKGVIGLRLRARSLLAQQTEAAIGVTILNRMLAWGSPKSAQRQAGDFPRRAIHLNIANRATKLS
ncbi:hypothetical protein RvVAR031_pl02170 (plasmid) [Agrobacterium vitis]|nr:hypothetical protein RvVAR031_pl02170 [Agrobacterium vitis]